MEISIRVRSQAGQGFAALPWLILVEALIPIGDAAVILGNRGSVARAFGVHGATAAVMVVAAVLLFLG